MGDEQINSAYLKYEWYRLQSFSNVKGKESVSFLRLAKVGFYYTGHIDLVKCYFCGYEWHDWSHGDIPVHCVERNQNIPIHSDKTQSLLVPSGQSLSGDSTTHFHHIIRPKNFLEQTVRASDFYRQNHSERINTSGNVHNDKPSLCESFRKKIERNGRRHRQPQNEEHNNNIVDTAVEIEGFAESQSTQCTEHARVTCKPPTTSDTRTSTTPIGPQCSTRNRHTSVNHTVVSPENSSEGSRINTELCRNSENVALHQVASPPLPHLGKRVNKCTGVPQVYRDRLATFQGMSLPHPADILAANGFYYVWSSEAVKCAYCEEVSHVDDSRQTSDTVHTPDCKFRSTQEVLESRETSSQPNSMSDNDVSSLPAVQEVKQIGFHTPDIVNAYREIASENLDFRCITQRDILRYFFEDDKDDETSDEDGSGCTCCNCLREVISEMYLPCRHGCCCDCKSRVLQHCPKCDAIIKSKLDIYT